MRWSAKLVDLRQNETGCTLSVETAQRREQIRSQWVVGADGAHSTVRNLHSLPFEGHTWPERFVATNVEYEFGRHGYEPANMIADPENWAVVARLGQEDLWRVTFAENAGLAEGASSSASVSAMPCSFLTQAHPIGSTPIHHIACMSAARPCSEPAASYWPATRPTSATLAGEWD